jgi:hypothetical protein
LQASRYAERIVGNWEVRFRLGRDTTAIDPTETRNEGAVDTRACAWV